MRVLHALETFLRVSENWIFPQIARVPGVTPAVLCHEIANPELFTLNGAPVIRDPPEWSENFGLPRLLNSLAFRLGRPQLIATRIVRRWQPQLIHAHFGPCGWEMLPLKRALGVPLITSFYGVDAWMLPTTGALWRGRLAELFAEVDLCLTEGPAMRDRLVAIGCPASKVEVVRIGADLAALPFEPRDFTPPLSVVMMARFVEKKGLPDGLRAFAKAVRRGADLQLSLIGDATDADGERIKAELQELARAPELAGRVTFEGFLSPVAAREILRRAHIFLCPSKHAASGDAEGGSPVALTEAMAGGLFCIGTRHCDIPELICDAETGFLCDSGDVTGLADALLRATRDRTAIETICRRARQRIEADFTIEQQTAALAQAYARVARATAQC